MGFNCLSVVVTFALLLQGPSVGRVIQTMGSQNVISLFDCKGKENGNYPHPTKCTHYISCVSQKYAYERSCAFYFDGNLLHYVRDSGPNPATSRCDYPEVAKCEQGQEDTPSTTTNDPFAEDETTEVPNDQDSTTESTTPGCEYPDAVDCEWGRAETLSTTTNDPSTEDETTEPPLTYDCSGKEDGNYPHPTSCSKYVSCVEKKYSYEIMCALNHDGTPLHYVQDSGPDPATSRCDYPEVAKCTQEAV